ncbi:AaceriAFR388Wp [[Ashbya] aceris (nom. inval.)]|nr:AaceriAFR388Wp [[Ashbya] aceris (nom. inval.)]
MDSYKYRVEIQQMMFVSGENNDPPVETTSLIEDIVRGQVIEILLQASKTAFARNSKSILPEDVIFLIRHDKAKVNRLRTYLSWKDLRKNAKDQDAQAQAAGASGAGAGGGPAGPVEEEEKKEKDASAMMKVKKSSMKLPWELQFMFNEQPLEHNEDDDLDEDEREANMATLKRLKMADDRTRDMTKEEYVHWSDCRQASFTFRKGKRFKDWSGISQLVDGKPHDDVVDILGFLTFEIVCSLTETALKIKKREEMLKSEKDKTLQPALDGMTIDTRKRKKRLFDGPDNLVNPLKPKHIEEAWRVLQAVDNKHRALSNFKGGRLYSRLVIM